MFPTELAFEGGSLNSEQKSFLQTVIDQIVSMPMRIETATIPTGFTTVTTAISYAIVTLQEGDIYFRTSNQSASNFWVVVCGKVPGIYDNAADSLAQVSGISRYHQQGGFTTMADAEQYMLSYIKKDEAWGIMVNQPTRSSDLD
ncbi:hypothetical protein EV421DRAFT_1742188 [Armillaria borealis]|uniref:Ribonuclease H1 N-terminal domain-containing protein n=1 Tax=Armillaria borealis TaxID=47425 RepID=A0AA39IY77_9AGAR|nr:hypothetical protein EV421DRAFT_1742188 [Armillaria borealis]